MSNNRKKKIALVVLGLLINTFSMSAMNKNNSNSSLLVYNKKGQLHHVTAQKSTTFTNRYGNSRENCVNFLVSSEMAQATLNVMGDPSVVQLDAGNREVVFIGDLHTSLNSLRALEQSRLEEKLKSNEAIAVFTGDYADPKVFFDNEGGHTAGGAWKDLIPSDECTGSYAVVCYIAHLKASYPNNVVLLRGNHESTESIMGMGFSWLSGGEYVGIPKEEEMDRLSNMAIERLRIFYKSLPFGVEITSGGKKIVAFHGCLSRTDYHRLNLDNYRFESIDCIGEGENKRRNNEENSVVELLWNDIQWDNRDEDSRRNVGTKLLKKDELKNMMRRIHINYFVHGHKHTETSCKEVSQSRKSICVISFDPCQEGVEGARVAKFKNGVPEIIYREDWVRKI